MSDSESSLPSDLAPTQAERLIRICDRFEADWRAGRRPRIKEIVCDLPEPDQSGVLRMLLGLELRLRRELGERPTPADYEREFPGRTDLISSVFVSMAAASIEADGDPTTSQDGTDAGPASPDATLSYCVGREGGRVAPRIDADQHQRLRGAFAPGGVVQGRYRIDRELGRGGICQRNLR
jgi:hypothetical protein